MYCMYVRVSLYFLDIILDIALTVFNVCLNWRNGQSSDQQWMDIGEKEDKKSITEVSKTVLSDI